MMNSQNKAAQYRSVRSHGLVSDATPARLVQIMFEQILTHLVTAHGCMLRIRNNLPLNDTIAKCKAVNKTALLLSHLDGTLDRERGGDMAKNMHALYEYMLRELTLANSHNDAARLTVVMGLVRTIKTAWDQLVKDGW
jgi:flagellar protein FliS